MPSSATVLGIAALYLAASLVVGMWPGRKATGTAAGYVAGDRSLGLVVMYFITGATIFSAFAPAKPFPIHAGIYGIVANVIVLVSVSLLFPGRPSEEQRRFLEIARTPCGPVD